VLFHDALTKDIRTASSSSRVCPGTATVNALLLSVAAKDMGVSDDAAVQKLHAKMMLPVRKPAKGMALVVAYQYIKRVFGHLNSSISSVAVSTFVKRTHELKGLAAGLYRRLRPRGEFSSNLLRSARTFYVRTRSSRTHTAELQCWTSLSMSSRS